MPPGDVGRRERGAALAPLWRRVARNVAWSAVAWLAALGVAYWYLRRMIDEDLRGRKITDADSIGLPLYAFGMLTGGILVLGNLLVAVALVWRDRRE